MLHRQPWSTAILLRKLESEILADLSQVDGITLVVAVDHLQALASRVDAEMSARGAVPRAGSAGHSREVRP